MKRFFVLYFALCLCVLGFSQENVSKVVLKNGVNITGKIVELNPASHIVLNVAGFDTRIEMSEIASIEGVNANNRTTEEQGKYDETVVLQVGPYSLEMVLVQGATFDMGFDGRGSLSMFSEPVHQVQLSNFYVNKAPLSKEIVDFIMEGKESKNEKSYDPIGDTCKLPWHNVT